MQTRREFIAFVGCSLLGSSQVKAQARRQTVVAGRRIKVVDVHAHCAVPEAMAVMNLKMGGPTYRPDLPVPASLGERLAAMDAQGIDMQALSINSYWYKAERDVAEKLIRIQNEKLAEVCGAHPDRFVAYASVALQHPDLAAQQLEEGMKKYGLRGAAIGGSVDGAELSDPKFNPFWAKAESLGAAIFIHPQADGAPAQLASRWKGNGYLVNNIGNPLETTIALSHLIFQGTLDRYPGLKIIGAHGGGYLPSYAGRSDHGCLTRPDLCPGGAHGPIKKKPSEYLKQMYFDTMVFTPEGLRHLAAEVGADRLVIGTDYPYPWTKTAVEHVLNTSSLSDAEKAAILGETAQKLLRINA